MEKTVKENFKAEWRNDYALTDEQVRQLIENKLERARLYYEAAKQHESALNKSGR